MTLALPNESSLEPNLQSLITQYNFDNTAYQIETQVISDTDLSKSFSAGDGPDLMLFGSENGWQQNTLALCSKNGILKDLTDYLDNWQNDTKQEFIPNIRNNLQLNSGIYSLPYGFRARTIYTATGLGARENWTLAEFIETAKNLPDEIMITDDTQSGFLTQVLQWCGEDFVNTSESSCDFASPIFYDLLTLCCDALPADYDESIFQEADGFFINYLFSTSDFELLATQIESLKDTAVFTGFPDSNGGQFIFSPSIAITSSCKYPDEAWSFLTSYVTMKDKSVFVSLLQDDYNGLIQSISEKYSDDTTQIIKDLVEETSTVTDHYTPVPEIVTEEAEAFFQGEKTAEEAADIIQNRVSIYLSEQN